MPGRISPFLASKWLDVLATESTWASLHVADPMNEDPLACELDGIGYSRVGVTWTAGDRAVINANVLSWTNLPRTTLWAVGAFNAPVNGDFLFSCVLEDPRPYTTTGGVYTLAAGELAVVVDIVF